MFQMWEKDHHKGSSQSSQKTIRKNQKRKMHINCDVETVKNLLEDAVPRDRCFPVRNASPFVRITKCNFPRSKSQSLFCLDLL